MSVTDLSSYRHQRAADARAEPVHIEREIDRECANRSRYLIISASREAVQNAINGLIAEVESFASGDATFDGPHRFNGLYFATGDVEVHPEVPVLDANGNALVSTGEWTAIIALVIATLLGLRHRRRNKQGVMQMDVEKITVSRGEAAQLYRKYREHAAYSEPIDWEVQRTYDLLRKGKVIIRALESIKQAGLNREFLPKLALAPANAAECHIERYRDGQMRMFPQFPGKRWPHRGKHNLAFRENTFVFPVEEFPMTTWGTPRRTERSDHKAMVPIIPLHLRPKRGLQNYHVLWEAEWERMPPRDPYLLRRIGKADLWLVVAHWDLTEVERAALSTRV